MNCIINKTDLINILGISFLMIFSSCQFESKTKPEAKGLISDTVSTVERINDLIEEEANQIDTLTFHERRFLNGSYQSHIKLDFAETKIKVSDTNQIHLFDEVCAISIIPDTNWINKQQKELGSDWNEIVSDKVYYEGLATDTLNKIDIPTIFASRDKQFICFIKSDKSTFMLDFAKMVDAWGLILFNGKENPVLWSSTDIDYEIQEIFNK